MLPITNSVLLIIIFEAVADKEARFIKAKEHTKDMIETRDYYRDRRLKREEIVAKEFLRKAVRELYIEEADRNKAKVSPYCFLF